MSANSTNAGPSPIIEKCLAAIPNLLVLSLLVGIGFWGHSQHWRIPKFSILTGSAEANSEGNAQLSEPVRPNEKAEELPPAQKNDAGRAAPVKPRDGMPLIRFPSGEALSKSGVTIGRVEERPADEYITSYGIVTYDETRLAQLSSRVAGIVWSVEKQLGEWVKKGDILAIIDSQDVGQAKARFLEADAASDLATKTLERLKLASQSIPEQRLREAEAEVRMAKVRRFNAQQTLINLGLPISLQATTRLGDDELAQHLHFLGLPDELVSSLNPETASANLYPLISPFEGMVIRRDVVKGEMVEPNETQFVVADVRRMWLILNVRKEDAADLEVGQSVSFSSTGSPYEVESRLTWIATEMDKRTRSVQVRAEVDNRPNDDFDEGGVAGKRRFRANMFGTGRIRIRQRPYALTVPSSAVQWDGKQHLVFSPLGDGTSFRACPVQLGVVRDGFTEIRDGVALGQQIVSSGSYLLKSELVGVAN